ncbi:DUF438 domain-containing protein [Facklamia sp. DSM 111018]|uniref:DUF438 domain-containing protein n=1 Tax=Facklamia lactis TaxID=2749967 RepID=A0ABS0LQ38_9LACT|nr:DUF438 domain-containing protein [Facklamia lactis]MBG9986112.1 DUF438 domain-containing protein [Facklamia lactis]
MHQDNKRISILKDILLRLHQGADPKTVQEDFNRHFTGVSAIEISMMEHQLISEDNEITFEDVMKLCNVHANLFKGAIHDNDIADADLPGHPVRVLKDENLAFQASLMRINRLLDNLEASPPAQWEDGLLDGLKKQMKILGQFKRHYNRKEEVIFPIMERYGHNAPPKVMWGVDDEIRDLYTQSLKSIEDLPDTDIKEVKRKFQLFEVEFREMIFKEEAILIQILLEILTEDDWLTIAENSEDYGYAIVKPTEKWQPKRENLEKSEPDKTNPINRIFDVTDTDDQNIKVKFETGYLTLKEIDRIFDHLQLEITFVSKDNFFTYFNNQVDPEPKILPRNTSAIGRHVEKCHPPRVVEKVKRIFENLQNKITDRETMWFSRNGFFALIIYRGVYDKEGEFMGVLETVQNIEPLFELQNQPDQRQVSTDRSDT